MISLCMVVRDEAEYLASSIESTRPVVDEIIVVDTGSKDETTEIARTLGATVYQKSWPGDFASAYNLFLPYARGDWIFNLDADEVLDPRSRSSILTLAKGNGFDGYLFTAYNYTHTPTIKWRGIEPGNSLARGAMGYRPSQSVRLFRNHPENRYSGEVHQSIRPSILDRGGRIGTTEIPIHHYGLLREDRIASKITRYLNMAKKKVKSQPDNFRAWLELGLLLLNSAERKGAIRSFYKARSLEHGPSSAFFMGHMLIETGKPHEAIEYLEEAIQKNPDDKVVDFDRADAYEEIGRAYELLGRPQEAEKSYRLALSTRPDSPIASHNLAGLLSVRGALFESKAILEKLLSRYPRLGTAWTTHGINKLRSGDLEGARTAFEIALKIDPNNFDARNNLTFSLPKIKFPPARMKVIELPKGINITKEEMKKSLEGYPSQFSNLRG
jgi:glycosyltransferase involved in cell wall biosynthesis